LWDSIQPGKLRATDNRWDSSGNRRPPEADPGFVGTGDIVKGNSRAWPTGRGGAGRNPHPRRRALHAWLDGSCQRLTSRSPLGEATVIYCRPAKSFLSNAMDCQAPAIGGRAAEE